MNRALSLTAAALAVGAVLPAAASANVGATCVPQPNDPSARVISIALTDFPTDRPVNVPWRVQSPSGDILAAASAVNFTGATTFDVELPRSAGWVKVIATWGPDPVRDRGSVVLHAACSKTPEPPKPPAPTPTPEPPTTPPTAPEPPSNVTLPPLPAKPDNPCPASLVRAVNSGKAGPRWVREAIERGCLVKPRAPKRPKVCPRPTTKRTVIIRVRTKSGRVVLRRVATCIPPRRFAPNPTG